MKRLEAKGDQKVHNNISSEASSKASEVLKANTCNVTSQKQIRSLSTKLLRRGILVGTGDLVIFRHKVGTE
uniref:Uncharacterized protein n=1 Tax=Arundo donax TaxID=35708 RepID=A0A0A9FI23_ARUDO